MTDRAELTGEQEQREAFEKWARGRLALTRPSRGDVYLHFGTVAAWESWQACAAASAERIAEQRGSIALAKIRINELESDLAAAQAQPDEPRVDPIPAATTRLLAEFQIKYAAERNRVLELEAQLAEAMKAIEFGEYLAKSAEGYQQAANRFIQHHEDGEEPPEWTHDSYSDHHQDVSNCIYEFHKRAERAVAIRARSDAAMGGEDGIR